MGERSLLDERYFPPECKTVLFYCSKDCESNAYLLFSQNACYFYFTEDRELFLVPNLSLDDPAGFRKRLDLAPNWGAMGLIKIERSEILGGPRHFATPEGWKRLPESVHSKQLEYYPGDESDSITWPDIVLQSLHGNAFVMEHGEDYYLWLKDEEKVNKIIAPSGLEEILQILRSGGKFSLVPKLNMPGEDFEQLRCYYRHQC